MALQLARMTLCFRCVPQTPSPPRSLGLFRAVPARRSAQQGALHSRCPPFAAHATELSHRRTGSTRQTSFWGRKASLTRSSASRSWVRGWAHPHKSQLKPECCSTRALTSSAPVPPQDKRAWSRAPERPLAAGSNSESPARACRAGLCAHECPRREHRPEMPGEGSSRCLPPVPPPFTL